MEKPLDYDEPAQFQDYQQYLKSFTWQEKRTERLKIDGFKCANCGSTRQLQVHHIHYPNHLGTENVYTDLITLCADCHAYIHDSETFVNPAYTQYYKESYARTQKEVSAYRQASISMFIALSKPLDIVFGGRDNFCKAETVKEYWKLFCDGADAMCPCSVIQNWYRDRRIEKIFR